MAEYRVTPLPDEVDQAYGWQVKKVGVGRKSTHFKQSTAIDKMYEAADSGDTLYIHRTNGTLREKRVKR